MAPDEAPLWTPSQELLAGCRMHRFLDFWNDRSGANLGSYPDLHQRSTHRLEEFWQAIWDFFEVRAESGPTQILSGKMPHARWFSGARLNYAEHALRRRDQHTAVIFRSETGERIELSYAELAENVGRARAGLERHGVGLGDRVAALAPNRPETLALFLATASLGAIWSSCSPEFGVSSVLDRFRQIEPKLLLAVDGYDYGGKRHVRSQELAKVRAGLPSVEATVVLGEGRDGALGWDTFTKESAPPSFTQVPFEHPLWILYSSGTTGLPKAIVHGHGGILLEHLKVLALHSDLRADDRFFWFSTTGWMMWNYLVSGLCLGATLVLYDGSPAYPDLGALYRMAEEEKITYFGTSAPYLLACQKAGITPKEQHDLSRLRAVGTTGAPLPASGFRWVYDNVGSDLLLGSVSGGTDVCTAFVLSCPMLPVYAGEIQCAGLGAKVEAFDEQGRSVTGQVGELVLTEPMPSMPIQFWNDPGDARRIESYFSMYPGVWRHGDWVEIKERGSFVIYGRSDSTLNRGGVRMGTSEFYRVVESLPEIKDSLVVDTASSTGEGSGVLWLFLVMRRGASLDAALLDRIKRTLRSEISPRHVPDEVRQVAAIPKTLNGKKLEIPVKKILLGTPPERALSRDTLQDPAALDPFLALAAAHKTQG